MDGRSSAPTYPIHGREVIAVEHPMVIKNLDNGLKTFGRHGKPFARVSFDRASRAAFSDIGSRDLNIERLTRT
jgi:hypothetical protein